ncbi:MAG: hypothetical protein AB7O67_19605 [Vicinamibacterales bacterium]
MRKGLIGVSALALAAVLSAGCAWRMSHIQKGFDAFTDLDYVTAEKEFSEALEDDPDNPYAQLNLGAVFQNTGRPLLAIPLYQKVLVTGKDVRPTKKANAEDDEENPTLAELAQQNLDKLKAQGFLK